MKWNSKALSSLFVGPSIRVSWVVGARVRVQFPKTRLLFQLLLMIDIPNFRCLLLFLLLTPLIPFLSVPLAVDNFDSTETEGD